MRKKELADINSIYKFLAHATPEYESESPRAKIAPGSAASEIQNSRGKYAKKRAIMP